MSRIDSVEQNGFGVPCKRIIVTANMQYEQKQNSFNYKKMLSSIQIIAEISCSARVTGKAYGKSSVYGKPQS